MRIAITGASGFIGRNLVKGLAQTDHNIIALIHNNPIIEKYADVISLKADIQDSESLAAAFKDVDVVFHLVGIIVETRTETFQKTVISGTENVIRAARKNGVKKIIYLSALGTSRDADTEYFKSKWAAEEMVRNSGINFVILRPSTVFGPEDKFINMLAGMIRRYPVVPIIGDGTYLLQPIFVEDLTKIFLSLAESNKLAGQTIELGGPEKLQFKTIIALLQKMINKRRINIYIPIWLAKMAAFILERVMKPAPLTTDQIEMLLAGNICTGDKLDSLIEIKLTSLEEGLRIYLR